MSFGSAADTSPLELATSANRGIEDKNVSMSDKKDENFKKKKI